MKPFTTLAFAILILAGLVHLLRLVMGFSLVIAGCDIPRWANAFGAVLAFVIAWKMRDEARS